MRKRERLSPAQRIRFLREGYLVVPGEFSRGMILDLLDALEEEEKGEPGTACEATA